MSPNTVFILRIAFFFSAISAILCGLTFRILKKRLHLSTRSSQILAVFLFFIFILIVGGPIHYRTYQPDPASSFSNYLQVTQYFLMGWIGVIFLVFFALEITLNLFKKFDQCLGGAIILFQLVCVITGIVVFKIEDIFDSGTPE